MKFNAPRGTHDLWGKQAESLSFLEKLCSKVFQKYNYSEIRFPSFEDAGLFTRSIGETTDIVEKEMYVFEDKKGRKLALRPEGTASVVRALIENNILYNLPLGKLYYMGQMFRYERPQAGRYREFYQIGAEYFANPAPSADAEIIILADEILKEAGVKDIKVHINTLGCEKCRPAFRAALKEYLKSVKGLCSDCVIRVEKNPLRVLDCKIDSHKFTELPKMEDFLDEDCKKHFKDVQELLKSAGCVFTVDHKLVRGLDYYGKTVFEIRSGSLGSQDALCAGGRYDNLVEELGGNPTPAVGFALGSERVIMALENQKADIPLEKKRMIFIAVSSSALEKEAFRFVAKLRSREAEEKYFKGISEDPKDITVEGPFSDKSLKLQLRLADKLGAEKTVIFGDEEFKRGTVLLRDMKTQSQSEISVKDLLG